MLCLEDSIGVVRKRHSLYHMFNCKRCHKVITAKRVQLAKHSGICRPCLQSKRPFESLYNSFVYIAVTAGWKVEITYEQFLTFTDVTSCQYCQEPVVWLEHRRRKGDKSRRYNLDRMDSFKHYTLDNCIVCCQLCNGIKGNKLSYDEFLLLAPTLKLIYSNRKDKT